MSLAIINYLFVLVRIGRLRSPNLPDPSASSSTISLSVQTFKAGFQPVPAFYALLATQNLGSSSKGPSHPRAVVQAYHSCGVVRQNIGLRTADQFYPLFASARNLQGLTSVVMVQDISANSTGSESSWQSRISVYVQVTSLCLSRTQYPHASERFLTPS